MRQSSISRQSGVTALGWLVILMVLGFFILLALKVVPLYLEHYRVAAVLQSLPDEPRGTYKTPKHVRNLMIKRLKINYVWDFDKNNIEISKSKNGYDVKVEFESRANMFGNLDVVMRFKDSVDVAK